jgi:beta-glucosidase
LVAANKNDFNVQLSVKNNGQFDGDELVQLYVRRINKNTGEPISMLKNFKRVLVKKGSAVNVSFLLAKKDLEYWDDQQHAYLVYPGDYELMIGSSSADIKLTHKLHIN